MRMLISKAIQFDAFGYCVMVGYLGRFRQNEHGGDVRKHDESGMNSNPPNFPTLNGKGKVLYDT